MKLLGNFIIFLLEIPIHLLASILGISNGELNQMKEKAKSESKYQRR